MSNTGTIAKIDAITALKSKGPYRPKARIMKKGTEITIDNTNPQIVVFLE